VNDLADLREGWGQPEPPSDEACSAARAALLLQATAARAAMTGDPAASGLPARAAMNGASAGTAASHGRPVREARPLVRRGGWLAGAIGLSAAVAVAVAVVTVVHPGSHRAGDSQLSGRQFLLEAATTAAAAPASTGLYWHLVMEGSGPAAKTTRRIWYTHDGRDYALAPDGRHVYRPSPDCGFLVGGRWLTYQQIQHLPTAPDALKAWMHWSLTAGWQSLSPCARRIRPALPRFSRPDYTTSDTAMTLSRLLAEIPAPPAVRAAAFRALASMPDVKNVGRVSGGVVLAIYFPKDPPSKFPGGKVPPGDGVLKLIIDPTTFALRGSVSYQGTERILSAGWTNYMPKAEPVSKAFPPKPRTGDGKPGATPAQGSNSGPGAG
jgi:hypothetical protein